MHPQDTLRLNRRLHTERQSYVYHFAKHTDPLLPSPYLPLLPSPYLPSSPLLTCPPLSLPALLPSPYLPSSPLFTWPPPLSLPAPPTLSLPAPPPLSSSPLLTCPSSPLLTCPPPLSLPGLGLLPSGGLYTVLADV